jgi:acyl dehydratase
MASPVWAFWWAAQKKRRTSSWDGLNMVGHYPAAREALNISPKLKGVGMRQFETLDELARCVGQDVAQSDWLTVSQEQVDRFAQATGDHQWIHIDVARAKEGPFGSTIAHGFLTLSLLPQFFHQALNVRQVRMGVNYGVNKVRFPAPVPVGSRLRAQMKLLEAQPLEGAGYQFIWAVTVEREGGSKPVCVAESVVRQYA